MKKTNFSDSGFARLFLWIAKAKFTMGILSMAFVLVYLFFGFITADPPITLGLFTGIQMLFAGFFIGIAQQAILPVEKLSMPRCILWVAAGLLITLGFSLGFGWFQPFPAWCLPVFLIVLTLGMIAMVISNYLELHRETKVLNRQLAQFQSNKQPNH